MLIYHYLMEKSFADWLRDKLNEMGWTQAELARRSGVSAPQITRLLSGERGIGEQSISSIARALRLPPETVFRAAGLLPPEPEYVPLLDEWNAVFYELTPDEQQEMIDIARLKVDRRKSPGQQSNQKSPSRSKRPARSVLK